MKEIAPILIGGLVLFLFAIMQLSAVMQTIFSEKAKTLIQKYTRNLFTSILIGTLLAILFDSSSAIIILTIVFINSKTLGFKNAIGIIMGANIGTSFSSQIIALDIGSYSIVPLLIGLVVVFFASNERTKRYGKALLYFGLLFFGLFLMTQSMLPLKDNELFEQWVMKINDNHIKGTLIGGLITIITQSSSGTVGIVIMLGKQKLITAAGGIAIMLGAELGTCADTLIATIKGSMQAIKAGVFHLLFNLVTILIGLLLFDPFVKLIEIISAEQDIGNLIANAHMAFNIMGVLIFLPFVRLFERLLNTLIPDKTLV